MAEGRKLVLKSKEAADAARLRYDEWRKYYRAGKTAGAGAEEQAAADLALTEATESLWRAMRDGYTVGGQEMMRPQFDWWLGQRQKEMDAKIAASLAPGSTKGAEETVSRSPAEGGESVSNAEERYVAARARWEKEYLADPESDAAQAAETEMRAAWMAIPAASAAAEREAQLNQMLAGRKPFIDKARKEMKSLRASGPGIETSAVQQTPAAPTPEEPPQPEARETEEDAEDGPLRVETVSSQAKTWAERQREFLSHQYQKRIEEMSPLLARRWKIVRTTEGHVAFNGTLRTAFVDTGDHINGFLGAHNSGERAQIAAGMAELARIKGWHSVRITGGSKRSREQAMVAALAQGLDVVVANPKDVKLLEAARQRVFTVGGAWAAGRAAGVPRAAKALGELAGAGALAAKAALLGGGAAIAAGSAPAALLVGAGTLAYRGLKDMTLYDELKAFLAASYKRVDRSRRMRHLVEMSRAPERTAAAAPAPAV